MSGMVFVLIESVFISPCSPNEDYVPIQPSDLVLAGWVVLSLYWLSLSLSLHVALRKTPMFLSNQCQMSPGTGRMSGIVFVLIESVFISPCSPKEDYVPIQPSDLVLAGWVVLSLYWLSLSLSLHVALRKTWSYPRVRPGTSRMIVYCPQYSIEVLYLSSVRPCNLGTGRMSGIVFVLIESVSSPNISPCMFPNDWVWKMSQACSYPTVRPGTGRMSGIVFVLIESVFISPCSPKEDYVPIQPSDLVLAGWVVLSLYWLSLSLSLHVALRMTM